MTTDTRHYPVVMVTDPRHYLAIKPMPKAVNHVGLKITSRSLNPNYTCELPQRKEVAKKNFSRRKYQISQCGYHSSICAPYNEVGHVVLDSKNLILKTLGQKEKEPEVCYFFSLTFKNVFITDANIFLESIWCLLCQEGYNKPNFSDRRTS